MKMTGGRVGTTQNYDKSVQYTFAPQTNCSIWNKNYLIFETTLCTFSVQKKYRLLEVSGGLQ